MPAYERYGLRWVRAGQICRIRHPAGRSSGYVADRPAAGTHHRQARTPHPGGPRTPAP
eukprot:SAG31_NODE_33544_length_342_cov_1.267490_1_plen_57_part_10